MAERIKVLVLDDDPTGSQTVHSCPLLLRWDPGSLRQALLHPSPLLFLLANTRALDPQAAEQRVRSICQALKPALAEAQAAGVMDRWLIVSRGDSTLRGHFPLELEVIEQELGPFASTLLVPAFLPGGRTTKDGMHLLHGEPVHATAFAQDRLFGFTSSFLPAWVEEKTAGQTPADSVQQISCSDLEAAPEVLMERLAALPPASIASVDAERQEQLTALGEAIWACEGQGQRFALQSAASLINGLVSLPPQSLDASGLARLRRGPALPGLVLVGSHVPLADAQLTTLLAEPACIGIELDVRKVARLLFGPERERLLASLEQSWRQQIEMVMREGQTPVVFTSRGELHCSSPAERRELGMALAQLMARLAGGLAPQLGYVISKGGITTHTLLDSGLNAPWVELQGQLFAGLSLVLTPDGLPVITFPGNLGDASSLRQAWTLMQQP
jgi:uncharacterized protein YgbK (DUF1537 family)